MIQGFVGVQLFKVTVASALECSNGDKHVANIYLQLLHPEKATDLMI